MKTVSHVCAALLVLLLASSPVLAREALVVFGTTVRASGQPGPALRRRLQTTLRLAKQNPSALVVVTGGAVHSPINEGKAMASWLQRHGISLKRILVEDKARHTGENADFVVPLLAKAKVTHATVVTERYHVPRATFHLRAALREQGVKHLAVTAQPAPDGLQGSERQRMTMKEAGKILRDRRWRAERE